MPVQGQQPQGIVQSDNEEELPQCPGGQLWNHCARCVLTAYIPHVQVIYKCEKIQFHPTVYGRGRRLKGLTTFYYEEQTEAHQLHFFFYLQAVRCYMLGA